jgi:hypothetical protein
VTSLPWPASAALAGLLLASMGRAFAGPPARRPRRAAARALLGVTAACYLAGATLVVVSGSPLPGALLIGAGIEASCIGAWLVRGGDGPPGDGDGDGDGAGPAPVSWDWDAFDRVRAAWAGTSRRPRAGV